MGEQNGLDKCPCCKENITSKNYKMWSSLNDIGGLGSGTVLFFYYAKVLIYYLLGIFIFTCIYSIILYR